MRANSGKFESLGRLRSLLVLIFVITGIWYLNWRLSTMTGTHPLFSAALYAAEVYGFISSVLNVFTSWRLTVRESLPALQGRTVDVFIPTYNEPVDLVRRTVIAAKNMSYAHETWLLDDGNRPEMKELAERLEVRYLARTENIHAKAGNLNNALQHSSGEFIAIFDADHAPQKNFLDRTLGYFNNDKVAFVQTPQDFFNHDSYMHRLEKNKRLVWSEQSYFFSIILRGRDYWNAAFFCGSCGIIRRSALDKIGGFATETVTEDIHTSVRLHKAGYQSVYHCESLAYGIAPATAEPFLKQRIRWGQGNMQVLMRENILFTFKLTAAQKLNYLASIMTWFDGWQKGLFYVTPVIVLFTGILPINTSLVELALHVLPYYFLGFLVFEEVSRGYGATLFIEQYNYIRFAAYIQSTFALFVGKLKFHVTPKVRDPSGTASRKLWPAQSVFLLSAAAIPFSLVSYLNGSDIPEDALTYNVSWVFINCIIGFSAFRFTQRNQSFLRDNYRFPIPLPFKFEDKHHPNLYGTIDNVSAMGGRIYAKLPESARKGKIIEGYIYLPSGVIPVEAEIVSETIGVADNQAYVAAVGCRFIWNITDHQEEFESFLFGTNMQSKLHDVRETVVTPLEWLDHTLYGIKVPEQHEGAHWTPVEIVGGKFNAPNRLGLVNIAKGTSTPGQLMSFSPVSPGGLIAVRMYTRTRQFDLGLRVGEGVRLESTAGSCFLSPVVETLTLATKESSSFIANVTAFNNVAKSARLR